MVLPAKHNLKIWKGATFHYKFTYVDGNDASQAPKNLTGYTGKMIIKDMPNGQVLLTLDSSNNGVRINGSTGDIEIFISSNAADAPNTSTINWTSATYKLLIKNSQQTDAILYGQISVIEY